MGIPAKKLQQVEELWRCESCGQVVELDEAIVEKEYGFEGEAWGHHFPAEEHRIALSPCCRSFIVNSVGNFLPADMVEGGRCGFFG